MKVSKLELVRHKTWDSGTFIRQNIRILCLFHSLMLLDYIKAPNMRVGTGKNPHPLVRSNTRVEFQCPTGTFLKANIFYN